MLVAGERRTSHGSPRYESLLRRSTIAPISVSAAFASWRFAVSFALISSGTSRSVVNSNSRSRTVISNRSFSIPVLDTSRSRRADAAFVGTISVLLGEDAFRDRTAHGFRFFAQFIEDLLDSVNLLDGVRFVVSEQRYDLVAGYSLGEIAVEIEDFEFCVMELRQLSFEHIRSGYRLHESISPVSNEPSVVSASPRSLDIEIGSLRLLVVYHLFADVFLYVPGIHVVTLE